LVRSAGEWSALEAPSARRQKAKGGRADFGKGEFVERVLELVQEQPEQRTRLLTKGPDLEKLRITPPA
jgi:hypothetical protein